MVYELFSRRNRDKKEEPDIYVYDKFPEEFRNQFLHLAEDAFSLLRRNYHPMFHDIPDAIEYTCKKFAREKGLICIGRGVQANSWHAFCNYALQSNQCDFLDLIDFLFGSILSNKMLVYHTFDCQDFNRIDDIIKELNVRFKQHNLGYEFSNGMIIKKTNKVTHETIVKPALKLLCDKDFRGAEDEYLNAWKQFMDGNNQGAILNATKAFESFMKIICSKMHYTYDKEKDTARKLLGHLKSNNFFPGYLENHLNALITTLESGAPTVRNKTSGHGQGEDRISVPDDYATYVLNLVASNIVFLHSIYKEHHSDE